MNSIVLAGIDPGVNTGLATLRLDKEGARAFAVSSATILSTMNMVLKLRSSTQAKDVPFFLVMEDARLRTWFGQSGPERWQGAGSIKRDCQIWEEFLNAHKMPYVLVPPMHNRTKMSGEEFSKYTGIKRSNQHERDAAALLLPYNYKTAIASYEAKKNK